MDEVDRDCNVIKEHDGFYGETGKDCERISIRLWKRGNEEAGHTQIQPIQNYIEQIYGVQKEGDETKYRLYHRLPGNFFLSSP